MKDIKHRRVETIHRDFRSAVWQTGWSQAWGGDAAVRPAGHWSPSSVLEGELGHLTAGTRDGLGSCLWTLQSCSKSWSWILLGQPDQVRSAFNRSTESSSKLHFQFSLSSALWLHNASYLEANTVLSCDQFMLYLCFRRLGTLNTESDSLCFRQFQEKRGGKYWSINVKTS